MKYSSYIRVCCCNLPSKVHYCLYAVMRLTMSLMWISKHRQKNVILYILSDESTIERSLKHWNISSLIKNTNFLKGFFFFGLLLKYTASRTLCKLFSHSLLFFLFGNYLCGLEEIFMVLYSSLHFNIIFETYYISTQRMIILYSSDIYCSYTTIKLTTNDYYVGRNGLMKSLKND